MTIAQKGKRQLIVDGQLYLWRVISKFEQTHFDGVQASVSADESSLHIEYGLGQPPESRHLWVDGCRVPCPLFESDDGEYACYFNESRRHRGRGQAISLGPANDNAVGAGANVAQPIVASTGHGCCGVGSSELTPE